ncbi:MAG: Cof-type HAD-IIB family hydrolase, partial [Clostridiales bacterium]|nr:Cof-type HAD-IIB family hydrolase [Clostridiales bacterium]
DTLLRRDKTIGGYTVQIFQKLRERGVLAVFATARALDDSAEYRAIIEPDGDVVTGGCLIFSGGKLLGSHYLPEPQGAALLADLCGYPSVKRVSGRSFSARYANIPMEGRILHDFKYQLDDKLLHCSCRTDNSALMESIAVRYSDFSILHVSGSDLYDINPKEATKLNGIKSVARHFSIALSEVAAFGDDFNDVEMLRECGTGVAMANAIAEAKAAADYICGSNDNDGVAKWLEENVL